MLFKIESLVGETELRAIRVAHTYTRANSMRTFVDVQEMTNTMPCSMPANPNLVYEGKSATFLLPEVYEKWTSSAEAGGLSINRNFT
jgi:hypothetical protein